MEIVQQVFLAGLTKGQAIDGQTSLEPFQPANLAAEWEHGNTAFDFDRAFVNPIRNEICIDLGFGTGGVEHRFPGIVRDCDLAPDDVDLPMGQV